MNKRKAALAQDERHTPASIPSRSKTAKPVPRKRTSALSSGQVVSFRSTVTPAEVLRRWGFEDEDIQRFAAGVVGGTQLDSQSTALNYSLRATELRDIMPAAKQNQRKGRKMSRRCGQRGYIEPKGRKWHLRYWYDTPNGRVHRSEPICYRVGKEKKTESEAKRLGAEWLASQGINSEGHLQAATTHQVTFRQQSEAWLDHLQTRSRRPIPKSSVASIQSALNCWLLPHLGDMPLSEVNNASLRQLVAKMKGHLAPKTITTYVNMAKEVVESLLNDDGEPVFVRKWNNDFIDLPIVNRREQRRPKITRESVTSIIGACDTKWERMLYILCPATGLRIAEALAIDIQEHMNRECTILRIRRQVKGNKFVDHLKTDAAYREVDVPPSVAKLLREYIGNRAGLLFPSKTGSTPMTYSNVRRRSLHPKLVALEIYTPGAAMHCFRRFRSSVLKKNRCPEHLEKFWLGHENRDITHEYAEQLQEDVEWRQEIAAQVGIGFDIPEASVVPNVPKKRLKKETAKAA